MDINKEFDSYWEREGSYAQNRSAIKVGYIAAAAPRDELLRETYEFMSNGSAGSYEAGLRWDKFLSRLRERGYGA